VAVDGQAVDAALDGPWLRVPVELASIARPITVTLAYSFTLPEIDPGAWGWRGTLGWTPYQVNLGDWHPALAPYQAGEGWLTPPPTLLGEYSTTPAADFSVRLTAEGFAAPPQVVGSGQRQECPELACFRLAGGRFAAYVLSDVMEIQTREGEGGARLAAAYLPGDRGPGLAALEAVVQALPVFTQRFGPLPLTTYTQVEGDFYDGMEYSALSFVGRSYYALYNDSARNLLVLISVHELAHQWWHTLVGNDPSAEPWLDEALATYSELLFLEALYPADVEWWWAYRVGYWQPEGAVNQPVANFMDFRGYVNAAYLRGAQMLQAMRAAVGDEAFFEFLRGYAAERAGRLANSEDFWAAYAGVGGDPVAIQAEYFAP
jgi:hypothetical protein